MNVKLTTFLNAIRCIYTLLNFRNLVTDDDDDDDDHNNNNSGNKKKQQQQFYSRNN